MRKSLNQANIEANNRKVSRYLNGRTQSLTLEQLQALGAVVKFVVATVAELDYLSPTFMDVAFVADANKFAMWNGIAWIVIGSYPIGDIYNDITDIIGGNCSALYVVETEAELPNDDVSDGSLAWVNATEAYYIYKSGWTPITIVSVDNYVDLPNYKNPGTLYHVRTLGSFYIARDNIDNPSITDWKSITVIETLDADLGDLPAISGDMAYTTDTKRYYIYTNNDWRLWDLNIEVVDTFPEIPTEQRMIWHTGDNQIWSAGPSSTTWIPLMSFTDLTGEVGT